jgi:heme/copper-type cytochrome/quinol oxidase subunit 3
MRTEVGIEQELADGVAARTGMGDEVLPAAANGPRSYGWWGMVWLIATEATLFGMLLASWFYIRAQTTPNWPPDGIEPPKLLLPLIMTVILWSSSIPVHLAERGIKRGSQRALRIGLAAGFVLGAVFLAMQFGIEWPETLREFGPRTNAFGSMFFTITGFHAGHVIIGLLLNLWTQMRSWQGAFDEHRHVTVQNFTLYWHFVDAVWAFVLVSLYLAPHVL